MVSGAQILFGGQRPGSVNASLPTALLLLWAGVLTVGGALIVAAAIVGPLLALYLEMVADLPLAVMCFVYSASVWMLAGARGAVPAGLALAVSIAFAVRSGQVVRSVVKVLAAVKSRKGRGR